MVEFDAPSQRLVEQRLRNRLIEALQLAASFEHQKKLDETVNAVNETINLWEDTDPVSWDWEFPTVYSTDEVAAVQTFHDVWASANARLPDEQFPILAAVQSRAEWLELRDAAVSALDVVRIRGVLPEDREV